MQWIVYINYWILPGISLLNIGLFLIWCIRFGGVEPLVVDKILRRYIEIGSLEPLVDDKILRRYCNWRRRTIGGWYIEVFWGKRWGYLDKSVNHWGSFGLKQGNTWQNFKIHSQLPTIFIFLSFLVHFLIISSST